MIKTNIRLFGGRGASSQYSTNEKLNKAILNEENKLVKYKREHATAFDDDGNILFRNTSNMTARINFSKYQIQQMKDATVTHNHPGGGTFSDPDINLLVSTELKTLQAAGPDTSYEMTKVKPNNNTIHFGTDFAKVTDGYFREYLSSSKQLSQDYKNGNITLDQYQDKRESLYSNLEKKNSDWLKNNAAKYGCKYKIIKRR